MYFKQWELEIDGTQIRLPSSEQPQHEGAGALQALVLGKLRV